MNGGHLVWHIRFLTIASAAALAQRDVLLALSLRATESTLSTRVLASTAALARELVL